MTSDVPIGGDAAGQTGDPVVAEGVYDYCTGHWSWSSDMWRLLDLHDDGRPAEDVVFERMYDTDRTVVEHTLDAAIAAGAPFAGQYRLRGDDGRERAIAYVGDVERAPDGSPVRLRGVAFDVSAAARQAASEAVAAATADRAAIEQVKGALMFEYGLDADAAFGLLSRYSQRGNVKVAVVARRVADLLARQDAPGTERSLLQVLEWALSYDDDVADTG